MNNKSRAIIGLILLAIVVTGAIFLVSRQRKYTVTAPSTPGVTIDTEGRYIPDKVLKTSPCQTANSLPDHACTPGAVNEDVTQTNINDTICVKGYTKTVRPPIRYTDNLKKQQMRNYGLGGVTKNYEEDHLISLELGGNPTDPANLWPEAYSPTPGAREKDHVENYLHMQVCAGTLPLAEAQKEISTNWLQVYNSTGNINSY